MMKLRKLFKDYIKYTSLNNLFKYILCEKSNIIKKYNDCQHLYLLIWFILIIWSFLTPCFVFVCLIIYRIYEVTSGVIYKIAFPKEKIIYIGRALILAILTYVEYIFLFAALHINIDSYFRSSDLFVNIVNAILFSATTITPTNIISLNIYSKILAIIESFIKTLYIAIFIYYAITIYFQSKAEKHE